MTDLAKSFVPSFKKRPDVLSKLAALDTLVFLKIVKMVFSETVARLKESLRIMPLLVWKTVFKVNLFEGLGTFYKRFAARWE